MKKLALGLTLAFVALASAFVGCSAESKTVDCYQEQKCDYSKLVVGTCSRSLLEENLGAFVLPACVIEHLNTKDIVPSPESLIGKLCSQLGHRPHLSVKAASDQAVLGFVNIVRQDRQSALTFLWLMYAAEREELLTALSATGVLTPEEVNKVLLLNLKDVYLRATDQQYGLKISQVVKQVAQSVQQNQGMNLAERMVQIRKQTEETARRVCIVGGLQKAQQNQEVMDAAIGQLNALRARNKQRSDNFWNWRERKLESTTPTKYVGSGTCVYCGGLVTVGGRCPASQDGRHHAGGAGPKMIDASHEGVRAW